MDQEPTKPDKPIRIKAERLQRARRVWLATRSIAQVQKECGGRYKTWQRVRIADDWDGMIEAVDAHDKSNAVQEAKKRRANNLAMISTAKVKMHTDLTEKEKKIPFTVKGFRQLVQTEELELSATYGSLGIGSTGPGAAIWALLKPLLEGVDYDQLVALESALAAADDAAVAEPDADPDVANPPHDETDEAGIPPT